MPSSPDGSVSQSLSELLNLELRMRERTPRCVRCTLCLVGGEAGWGWVGWGVLLNNPPCVSRSYKTELCTTFVDNGKCKYGKRCLFAHGEAELRDGAIDSTYFKQKKASRRL